MNYKMMGRFIAQTLFVETVFMIPAALITLGGLKKIAKNYIARNIKNKDVEPILSYDEALNAEAAQEVE